MKESKRSIYSKVTIGICFYPLLLSAQTERMNVLLIMADDLNLNIGAYGHYLVKTPNIDKLAREGMLFTNAYCQFPLSGPSRTSMLTGLYAEQSGMTRILDLVRDFVPNAVTLPQCFMNNGYTSARVGKIYHYNNPQGIGTSGHDDPSSWNQAINPIGIDRLEEDKIHRLGPGNLGATLCWYASEGGDEQHTDGIVASEAIKLIDGYAKNNSAFFLGVGFYKPHTPFVAPKKYFDLYPKDKIKIPKVPVDYLKTLPIPAVATLTKFPEQNNISKENALNALQGYYACISYLDYNVGLVLEALEKNGLRKNTIVVFVSDNGFHMGEHGHYQKMTLFENAGQVPLIVSYPGQKTKGKKSNSIVELIDIYPTLCDLAHITPPSYISGKSFIPILENPKKETRKSALFQLATGYSIRTKKMAYTKWKGNEDNLAEFYIKKSDPEEMQNLINDSRYAKQIKKMDEELQLRVKQARTKPEGITVLPRK
jgi:arylsulfatase A-like enzyme